MNLNMGDEDDRWWEDFLENHRFAMTRRVNPSRLYDWLRTKGVLSEQDQQEVEGMGKTTYEKCGILLDTVKRKGRPGFNALMEIVQYEYPHLYKQITGQEPEKPPRGFRESFKKKSHLFELMPQLLNVLNGISSEMIERKEDLKHLIDDLKRENEILRKKLNNVDNMEREQDTLKSQLLASQNYVIELTKDKEAIQQHCCELMQSRDDAHEQVTQLHKKVHDLELELESTKSQCNLERGRSLKLKNEMQNVPSRDDIDKLQQENKAIKHQLKALSKQLSNDDSLESLLEKAKENIKKLESDRDQLQTEKEEVEQQRDSHKMQVGQMQERLDKQTERLHAIKEERDKYLKDYESLYRQVPELKTQKAKLEAEREELWSSQDELQMELQELREQLDKIRGRGSKQSTPSSSTRSSLEEDLDGSVMRQRIPGGGSRPKRPEAQVIDPETQMWKNWSYCADDC